MMYTVYLLKSLVSNRNYVGHTNKDINTRLKEHNSGNNKWTSGHRPFKLIYYESYICKTDAMLRERFFKSGKGKQLKKLIVDYFK